MQGKFVQGTFGTYLIHCVLFSPLLSEKRDALPPFFTFFLSIRSVCILFLFFHNLYP